MAATTTAQAYPRFCSTCGAELPGPVAKCPRCGAVIAAAQAVGKGSGGIGGLAIAVIVGVVGLSCFGVLAAIAIPNFIRYQLRAKASEVRVELSALVKSEQALAMREGGRYVALPRTPSAPAGSQKAALSAGDLQRATALDWMAPPAAYGRYAVATSEDGAAAALCGESDIDGDGQVAAFVAFLPDRDGAAPAAPCTTPVPYSPQFKAGRVEQLTGSNVF